MEQDYSNRRYVIFDFSEIQKVDFSQVSETSIETLRKSIDGSKTIIKYELPQPSSVTLLTTKSIEYTHDEILQILSTPEWIIKKFE